MPVATNDDEITYGPAKLGPKSIFLILGLIALGIYWLWTGFADSTHGSVAGYWQTKSIIAGPCALFLGIGSACALALGKAGDFPRVTMYSTGLSYKMGLKVVFESRWDSVGPFKLVYSDKGGQPSILAHITGENVSDNLRQEKTFGIHYLKLLDVDPAVLVSELNQVRANALAESDAS